MPQPVLLPDDDDGSWRNLPPQPPFDALRVRVLTAHFHRLDERWRGEHHHDPFDRIYYVTAGSAVVSAAAATVDLVPGVCCLIPALTGHRHDCRRSVTMYWTHLITTVEGERGLFEQAPGLHLRPVDALRTGEHFARLCTACTQASSAAVLTRSACALELLAPFADLDLAGRADGRERARFTPVLAAIEGAGGDGPLTVAAMAALAGMSADHFTKRFTAVFAMTPARYRQRRRLARAQRLLAESDITVDAVARTCGFCDGFHLSKVFQRFLHTTPSRYRARSHRLQP